MRTASDLSVKTAIPMHWDLWKFSYQDPNILEEFKKYWSLKFEILIMRIGDIHVHS